MNPGAIIPFMDQRIFWDIDVSRLDFQQKASFIIERVFERGDVGDIRNCRAYYGDETITHALVNAKYLSPITLYLASAVTGIALNEFRCYIPKQ